MGREFKVNKAWDWAVRWTVEGAVDWSDAIGGIEPDEIPAFIAWLQAGPPKKRYRFRDGVTFDFIPDYVSGRPEPQTWTTHNMPVDPEDIEEVWE